MIEIAGGLFLLKEFLILERVPDVMSSFRQPNKWQHKNNAQNTSNFLVKLDPLKNAGRDFPNG